MDIKIFSTKLIWDGNNYGKRKKKNFKHFKEETFRT